MSRRNKKPATPIASKEADPTAKPNAGAPDTELMTPDPDPDKVEERSEQLEDTHKAGELYDRATELNIEGRSNMNKAELAEAIAEKELQVAAMKNDVAPKADPAEGQPPAPAGLAKAAPTPPEKGLEHTLPNEAKDADVVPTDPPKIPPKASARIPADPRSLAPKVKEGKDRLPTYNIRKAAIQRQLDKGVHQGQGLPALPPGKWRIMRAQTVQIRGHVQELREGTVVSSQTHDVKYLKNAGVALHPVNDRARQIEAYGWDYDPRVPPRGFELAPGDDGDPVDDEDDSQ